MKTEHAPYESFGDARPAYHELQAIIAGTRTPGPNRLRAVFIRGEAYLDLAITDPLRKREWLAGARIAQACLGKLAIETEPKKAMSRRLQQGQLHLATASRFRQAEMSNWRLAANVKPPRSNYEQLLKAAETVLPLLKPLPQPLPDDQVRTTLLEFIPILLGARWKHNEPDKGWLGRMALYREQGREPLPAADKNPNWDSGITFKEDVTGFLFPEVRLSVKQRYRGRGSNARSIQQKAASYLNAGVLPVSAAKHGFGNPKQIVLSCLGEFESVPADISEDVELLAAEQLQIITKSLHETFKEHLEIGRPDHL